MKRIILSRGAIGVGVLLAVLSAQAVEKPVALDNAMVTVTVSDLHGFLDGAGLVATQVSPMMTGVMMANMLGAQLGDPQLTGIPAGKGAAVVVMNATNIFALVEVDSAQLAAYTNAAALKGLHSGYRDGLLVLGKSGVTSAAEMDRAAVAAGVLFAQRSPTIRIALKPASLIEQNNEKIQQGLNDFVAKMELNMQKAQESSTNSLPDVGRILEAELRVLLSLASQVQAVEVTLAPANGSIQITEVDEPVPGSRLAMLCAAPVVNTWNPALTSGVCSPGAFQLEACIPNVEALSAFVYAEVQQLETDMSLDAGSVQGLLDYMNKCIAIYGGTVCESILTEDVSGLSMDYVLDVQDEAAALSLLQSMETDLQSSGLMKLYEDAGMPMTVAFKENVREHNGVAIHQFSMTMPLDKMPEEQRAQFELMNLNAIQYNVAIFDGVMAGSMSDAGMDALIDRLKDPSMEAAPLVARSVYPAGAFYYGDFDVARYVSFALSYVPDAAQELASIKPYVAMLQGVSPITSAGYMQDGLVQWSVNVPGDLLARLMQIGMTMQMQQMQKQQNSAPQPMAEPAPVQESSPQTAP